MATNTKSEYLTVQQVADLLKVSKITVRRHIKRNWLKAIRIGNGKYARIRVKLSDLQDFIGETPKYQTADNASEARED